MPKEIQIEFKDGTIKKYRDRGWGTGKSTYKISTYGDKVIVEENYEQGFSIFKSKEKNEHNFRSSEIKKIKISTSQPTLLHRIIPIPPGETESFNSTLEVSKKTYTNINGRFVEGDFDLPDED